MKTMLLAALFAALALPVAAQTAKLEPAEAKVQAKDEKAGTDKAATRQRAKLAKTQGAKSRKAGKKKTDAAQATK
jgi:hypothetical protein